MMGAKEEPEVQMMTTLLAGLTSLLANIEPIQFDFAAGGIGLGGPGATVILFGKN